MRLPIFKRLYSVPPQNRRLQTVWENQNLLGAMCFWFLSNIFGPPRTKNVRVRHNRRPDRFRRLDIHVFPQKSVKTKLANAISPRQRTTFGPQLLVSTRCPIAWPLNAVSAIFPDIALANRNEHSNHTMGSSPTFGTHAFLTRATSHIQAIIFRSAPK